MNSRERLLTTFRHEEPDRVPWDLGGCQVTGIHVVAYQNLRTALGMPECKPALCDSVQQLAAPEEEVLERLGVDTRGLYPLNSHNWKFYEEPEGEYLVYRDEWGITHNRPNPDGLYCSIVDVPLGNGAVTVEQIQNHAWPNMGDPVRIAGLRQQAERYRAAGYAVMLKDPFCGIFEMAQRIVGMAECLMMMSTDEAVIGTLFDKILELKLDFWEMALPELGEVVDVVTYPDDYGTQASQLISPDMFRRQIKPRLLTLFDRLKRLAPSAKRFFHSDGNIVPLLPDFADIGVDILNPLQYTAEGMDLAFLKREFGDQFILWGGGVDTQGVLPNGTPQEVKDDIRRNLDILSPGGGYVFGTVHNTQADVPPENILAMWEALGEYGQYG
jgi:uroporphyrinogen decarboxylase